MSVRVESAQYNWASLIYLLICVQLTNRSTNHCLKAAYFFGLSTFKVWFGVLAFVRFVHLRAESENPYLWKYANTEFEFQKTVLLCRKAEMMVAAYVFLYWARDVERIVVVSTNALCRTSILLTYLTSFIILIIFLRRKRHNSYHASWHS